MNSFDFFDKIYAINLDSRPDRWNSALKEFDRLDIVPRIKRIPGFVINKYQDIRKNACIGNHLSHAFCLNLAKEVNAKNVLIFEDDVQFIDDTLTILERSINQLPEDWDMLYLGANIEKPAYQISDNLAKLTFAYSTHAYSVNLSKPESSDFLDLLLKINLDENTIHNDVTYCEEIIPNYNCYVCVPIIAIQQPSFSDIEQRFVNYDWMVSRFNSNLIKKDVEDQT